MESLRITGGVPLHGRVAVSGAKNAALPIIAASLLADGPVAISRIPQLRDVRTLCQVLRRLGMRAVHGPRGRLELQSLDTTRSLACHQLVRRMRASFCVLGPLLARRREAMVALPGGCNIGHRPVDLHLAGLTALGAELQIRHGYVVARARRLHGARIDLLGPRGPTVTGTANVMCAAALARGQTVIQGAAQEPEIVDLADFLNSLGATIWGAGTSTIEICGVDSLQQSSKRFSSGYTIIPDRIESATLLIAGAITGGDVDVAGVEPVHLTAVLDVLRDAGAQVTVHADRIQLTARSPLRPFHVTAAPYPGVPTDIQSQLLALACVAAGRSSVRDDVFPERWLHVAELVRMGACIQRAGNGAVVNGRSRQTAGSLSGTSVRACDLRASAALVLAALAARGETNVQRLYHLDRGYERLDRKLSQLGAHIERTCSELAASAEGATLKAIGER